MATRTVLLNPGPVNLTPGVRAALTKPDLCHREPEFGALQRRIRSGLLRVYGLSDATYTSFLLSGSGTLAVEAMISSLVPPDGGMLILSNGVYGERMRAIAAAHAIPHTVLALPWGDEFDPAAVEHALDGDPRMTHVAVVHHETTTGRLNAIAPIGRICGSRGKGLLLDAVSSFGAEAIDFEHDHVAACAVSANKCLHGAPGLAFVVCRRALVEQSSAAERSVYLDLRTHWKEQEKDSCAFTPPVHLCYALDEALTELFEAGGVQARHEQYQELATLVRERLRQMQVQPYLTSGPLASALTAFHLPAQTTYQQLHDHLRESGFVIYAGQGGLSPKIFRIANMGDITPQDLEPLFQSCSRFLCALSS